MVQITGTYELITSENYSKYLAFIGLTPEQAQKASQTKLPVVVVTSAEDKQISILFRGIEKKTFVFNQEIDHTLLTGHEIQTVTTKDGDTVIFKSKTKEGSIAKERVFKFTDSGLISPTSPQFTDRTYMHPSNMVGLFKLESTGSHGGKTHGHRYQPVRPPKATTGIGSQNSMNSLETPIDREENQDMALN